jgi:hypothetical protein
MSRTVKQVFKNTPEGKRSVGKPKKKWLDDAENGLKEISVKEAEEKKCCG